MMDPTLYKNIQNASGFKSLKENFSIELIFCTFECCQYRQKWQQSIVEFGRAMICN